MLIETLSLQIVVLVSISARAGRMCDRSTYTAVTPAIATITIDSTETCSLLVHRRHAADTRGIQVYCAAIASRIRRLCRYRSS